ncbi:MAG: toprim domain-containing protein, partial [Gemmatimonadales bacterium]
MTHPSTPATPSGNLDCETVAGVQSRMPSTLRVAAGEASGEAAATGEAGTGGEAKLAAKKVAKKPAKKKTAKKTSPAKKSTAKKKTAKRKTARKKRATKARGGSLVIVESPTKARTVARYLGRGFSVKATVGHVRDLPKRQLGVDVENGFKPKYVTIKGKAKTLTEIKRAAKVADAVYLATDPDREGEAIAWHVAEEMKTDAPVHRVLFHEITKDAIKEAMRVPGVIDDRKVKAQQAR